MSDSSVSTKNVWPYYAKTNISNVAKEQKTNDLGKDEFLKILIAQLQNQDPSQPLQDKEFIAQMAQFTSVEQLSNMSNEMKLLRQSLGFASGLIGKSITWGGTNEKGESIDKTGIVDSIVVKDGSQFAVVGKEKIALDQITQIANSASSSPEESQ
ncbi:flagellar hook capping protein [Paenibacillus doosanensis]|uniref:Basal-body rod modification protein FlgD n=1 Tax=Paenibacillus konkukensis TaxID=2020716 RepID=A0ABY4RXC4_9BACL|nr:MULTISPECIES: flagellar hook capping FlgD N-terminal domain-containing protein [Paenibacillus]MCS7461892.1 flagellar hook capping protein [Paenibacillus doosanensis]UQZ87339.1 Basal-body rod modification protein FlgD [Paenibacillus konkukensis]